MEYNKNGYGYYTMRSPIPGEFPNDRDNRARFVMGLGSRKWVERIGRRVFGYIRYNKPLTAEQKINYQLIEADEL